MQLRRLQRELIDYAPPALPSRLLRSHNTSVDPSQSGEDPAPWWLFSEREAQLLESDNKALTTIKGHAEELAALDTLKGILLTGPPGTGKSFIVDLWYASIPTPYKARKHYNQLVLEIYRGVWEETQRRMAAVHTPKATQEERAPWNTVVRQHWRKLVEAGVAPIEWTRPSFRMQSASPDPTIAFIVAKRLVLHHWLLVFDEIQLLDVSSASLLADVLSWYWRMGGVIIGTSNKVPDDLYKNGVQRDRLEPFVEALKARCPIVTLDNGDDYWQEMSGDAFSRTWYTYDRTDMFHQALERFTIPSAIGSQELTVFGRKLVVPWVSGAACKFSFSELCDESIGLADYMTLASTFPVIAITGIPVLPISAKNQARRFISLIDALYEARCKIICQAEADPEGLFFPDALSKVDHEHLDVMMAEAVAETQDVYRPNVSSYDSPNMREAPAAPVALLPLDKLSIFSGEDEQFAFKRALSRLLEMTGPNYNMTEGWSPIPSSSRKWEGSAGVVTPSEATRKPPQFNAEHVWGVRDDWGAKAKDWGKGTGAYDVPPSRR
ncbi:AFG1-like ATPase-domain-containing protein [Crucibulum laeve]|uniref:AFG1-like ATPase-domain-containing protein n=1 Tax=Crucibulum laeve TaxID=68775 RepID=A0A5C3MFZ3_9AGAR|nr:AFG1-like ATPase-domain-containing protein [Crucibulum laeve]